MLHQRPTPSCCTSPASLVRPQGRSGGGMAGIRLAAGEQVVWFGAVDPDAPDGSVVVTASGASTALPGTEPGSVKVTPFTEYPPKGRGTGGVRCHRFLKGEDTLVLAWAGTAPPRAAAASGAPVDLPEATVAATVRGSPGASRSSACAGPLAARLPASRHLRCDRLNAHVRAPHRPPPPARRCCGHLVASPRAAAATRCRGHPDDQRRAHARGGPGRAKTASTRPRGSG